MTFLLPRAREFGVVVAIVCCECAGTGTSGEGDACRHCETCDGSGEVEVFDGEIAEGGHA